ncbi:Spectinomycin tetracycline efflux pump [Serratia fonticola]|uniref:MFS transporter n=1 Tax=Serratia fonticola TaxID=47917 RepID=UPI00217BB6FA|nr:MFS transporter [Serratia fonticola]CAI0726824.1 Spectinomycin tetracycline efflux pump [Serratia fonticola]
MKAHRPSLLQAALVTSLGYIVVQLDVTIVNVALPTFARIFQADMSGLQWIPDAYVIVFAALLLAAGGLSDRFGSRRINLVGMVIFLFASLICASATSIDIMIVGRIGQGVGAALILPSSLALLSAVSEGDAVLRTKAIGWWSAIGGIISAAGPFIGGLILKYSSWHALFLINIPLCLAGIIFTLYIIKEPPYHHRQKVDTKGIVIFIIASFSLVFLLINFGKKSVYSLSDLAFIILFFISATQLIRHLRNNEYAFIPPTLLRTPIFSMGLLLGATMNFSFYGSIFILTIYFQVYREFSPVMTGLALLTFTIIAVANTASGYLSERFGPRLTIMTGLVTASVTYTILAFLTYTDASYLAFVCFLFLMPIGGGIALPTLISAFIHAAPADKTATASAAINSMRQIGGAIGVALLGLLVSGVHFPVNVGAATGFLIAAFTMLITVLLTYTMFYESEIKRV